MVARVRRTLIMLAVSLGLTACPRSKIPEANATYFWQVTTSTLEWGSCGDSMSLRGGVSPITVAANSFLIYRVDATGKKAVSQTCPQLDVSTCTDSTSNIIFDIAGSELTFASERTDAVQNSTCQLRQNETWTMVDKGTSMTLEINTVLSLTGSEADCPKLEASVKAESANGLGIVGCVISRKLEGTLK